MTCNPSPRASSSRNRAGRVCAAGQFRIVIAPRPIANPDFFDLYRTLQVYRTGLTAAAPALLLSPSSELMKFFDGTPMVKTPPATDAMAPPPAPEK
jgi:hypothetical protein